LSKDTDFANVKIDINVKDASIEAVLDECFKDLPLSYKVIERTVMIRRDDNKSVPNEKKQNVQLPITGKVRDETGKPLPGVSVRVKGTSTGTATDAQGNYVINVADRNSVLSFSFIGYISQEIKLDARNEYSIQLQEDESKLEEVVVVGYGTQKREN